MIDKINRNYSVILAFARLNWRAALTSTTSSFRYAAPLNNNTTITYQIISNYRHLENLNIIDVLAQIHIGVIRTDTKNHPRRRSTQQYKNTEVKINFRKPIIKRYKCNL